MVSTVSAWCSTTIIATFPRSLTSASITSLTTAGASAHNNPQCRQAHSAQWFRTTRGTTSAGQAHPSPCDPDLPRRCSFADQPEGFREQRALQAVEDKAVDLARGFKRGAVRLGEPHVPAGAGEDRQSRGLPGSSGSAGREGTGQNRDAAAQARPIRPVPTMATVLPFCMSSLSIARAPCGAVRDCRAGPLTAPGESRARAPARPSCRTAPAPGRDCDRR